MSRFTLSSKDKTLQSSMISKAINLLSLIGKAKRPMTFSDLVNQSELSKSTVHRILNNLIDEQMIQHHKPMKVYLLGPKAFEIMKQAYGGYDLQALAVDGMMGLQKETGRNVSISVVEGDYAVVLRAFDSSDSFGGHSRPGLREPLHVCAAGKALVAYLPSTLLEAKFEKYDFFSRTSNTISSLDDFRQELEIVRKLGYATSDKEEYEYICGIAAPIFNYVGEVIASINVWGTTEETSLEELKQYTEKLIVVTQDVTDLIGGASDESKLS